MTIEKPEKIVKKDDKGTAPAAGKLDKDKALSTEDLDKVSGGINPQPLPPGQRKVTA